MKKTLLSFGLVLALQLAHSATFTSVSSGVYSTPATWSIVGADGDGVPDNDDDVIISSGHTVTMTSSENARSITTNPGGTLNIGSFSMLVWGNLTNNGSCLGAAGSWQFRAPGTFTGNVLTSAGPFFFYTSYTIGAGASINKTGGITVSGGAIVTNSGSVTLSTGTLNFLGANTAIWKNLNGSSLSIASNITGTGRINAIAASNTVTYSKNAANSIYTNNNTSYNNLVLSGTTNHTKSLTGDLKVTGDLTINTHVTLACVNHDITLGGSWNNSANTNCTNMATVICNGAGAQIINRSAPETFKNLTCSGLGSVTMATSLTVNGTMTLNAGTFSTGPFTMHQKGAAWIGNGGLMNSGAPGIVTFDGAVAVTLGGTTGTVFGNVQLNNASTITLTVTNGCAGFLDMVSSTLDVGAFNWDQSGSFFLFDGGALNTAAAGAVRFTGSAAQTISGFTAFTFGNIEIASSSTVSGTDNIDVLGNTTLTSGTLDPGANLYNQKGTSWFGNGGLVNVAASGSVVFCGSANQTIGGTSGTTFCNLDLNNPGNSITLAHDQTGGAITNLTAGTFDVSTFNFNQAGDTWNSNGGSINTVSTGALVFTGSSAQSIAGSTPVSFGSITIASSSTVTPSYAITCVKNFTITSGTYDVSASNFALNVGGNFTHNGGTFTQQTGVVTMNGTAAQTIGGAAATNFYDLTSTNTVGGVLVSSGLATINNILTVSSQSFGTSGGTIILPSPNATGTGRIAPLGAGASLVGVNWTVQSFINGPATAYWQYLGTPINGNSLADWDNDTRFYMSGVSGNDGNACCPIFYSVRTYSPATNTYTNVTSVGTALVKGRGYMVWMADNMQQLAAPLVYDSKGLPNFGNVTRAVTAGGPGAGYNLVSNPYACPVTFASIVAASGNLGPNFSILQENGTYVVNPNAGTIAANQGFMAVCTSSGNMTFTEACKNTAANPNIIRLASDFNIVRIRTTNDVNGLGGETTIQFADDSHNGFDLGPDMMYLPSPYDGATNVWTTDLDNDNMLCNALDAVPNELNIPVTVSANVSGKQNISFCGLDRVNGYSCAWLEDLSNGAHINLIQSDNYSFDAQSGEQHQFVLHFERTGDCSLDDQNVATTLEASTQVYVSNDQLRAKFYFDETSDVQINIYDVDGREVAAPEFFSVSTESVNLTNPGAHGVYFVQIIKGSDVVTKKILY